MQVVRTGCTRTVLLIGRWAIKVPTFKSWKLFLTGLLANMQEKQFCTIKDAPVCPVIFSLPGGFLNVMPRCEPIIREVFFEMDMLPFLHVPVENKLDSFGWYKGRIVALDYGS